MINDNKPRLATAVMVLIFITIAVIFRLVTFQIVQAEDIAPHRTDSTLVVAQPERGTIYDRNGAILAVDGSDYQVGISPPLVVDPETMASELTSLLQVPRHELLYKLKSDRPYELLAGRISPEAAETLLALEYDELQIAPLPRRHYTQQELACHLLGYVAFDGKGGSGVEAFYQDVLEGEAESASVYVSPLKEQPGVIAEDGNDIVLTIDRTVQYVVEEHLRNAIETYGAESGTIIVMNPRTGAILAMANSPCFDPYDYFNADRELLLNPAVSEQYEPGSVMKLLTMAAALDSGTVTPSTTYNDTGVIVIGGHPIYNWDRGAYGIVDMTGLLAHSLNVGAATIATWMGPDTFYFYLQRFGFNHRTGIDLAAEVSGQLPLPGSSDWTEINLGTNAFGQGLAVTPLQMISAVSALANKGKQMEPYVVGEIITADGTEIREPSVVSQPVTEETAEQLTAMAINAVRSEVLSAQIDGYTVAGKTGTAQIPEGAIYHPTDTIASFIGWLPADDPEIIVLVKIDRPSASPWGSTTAAPTFAELTTELVALLNIPPDKVRLQRDVIAARTNQN